jgi:predicted AAA+ superfamily ATPase
MIFRDLTNIIKLNMDKFPVIAITGPRQSGKTTLVKKIFHNLPYVSLEDIDIRTQAQEDPRGFLNNFPQGAIFDEVQRVPELFSYIQTIVDNNENIKFALTGSQNFLLLEKVSQSLAGRVFISNLLNFSISELQNSNLKVETSREFIFKGLYPRIHDKEIEPIYYYPSYISSYVERDIRTLKNIGDLHQFNLFLRLCAGRTGQLLNMNSLSVETGVSINTIKSWISMLEASYIIYLLQPFHNNYNKRITKSPKLYFYDTGLVCSLLGIEKEEQVDTHFLKGALFENFIINEFLKNRYNKGLKQNLFYWQNKSKQEIDLIVDIKNNPKAYEIKSSMTMQESYLNNLKYWQKVTNCPTKNLNVIYNGDFSIKATNGNFVSWKKIKY